MMRGFHPNLTHIKDGTFISILQILKHKLCDEGVQDVTEAVNQRDKD